MVKVKIVEHIYALKDNRKTMDNKRTEGEVYQQK